MIHPEKRRKNRAEIEKAERKECPFYQGVCGLDESYVCFGRSSYLFCKLYQKEQEQLNEANEKSTHE